MSGILDYIAWRGDLRFEDAPFNEVDSLILAELSYTIMEELVPGPESPESVSVKDVCAGYERRGYSAKDTANDAYPLLRAAASCARFASLRLSAYVNRIDVERSVQFAAVCFHLGGARRYIAFRGTDNTIVGWREDFTICYLSETPGQQEAVRYLNRVGALEDGEILVGGHSKGGNLAIYASAFCDGALRDRITAVYSCDGPGFNQAVVNTPEYLAVLDKVRLYLPESSMIGILLSNKAERTHVKSSGVGVQQHDPYTWQVLGPAFVTVESPSAASLFLDETLRRWLDGLTDKQRSDFVRAIFDTVEASGAQTLNELKASRWNSYSAILKAVRDMDPSLQKEVLKMAQLLAQTGYDVLMQDAQTSFRENMHDWLEQFSRGQSENKDSKGTRPD